MVCSVAQLVSGESDWVNGLTSTAALLGGESAIKTIQDLVGHAQSFDLSDLKDVPPLDLPDLLPFFENCLVFNRRRPKVDGLALSFKTPEEWLTTHAIKKSYENVVFDRKASPSEGELMGVGHPLMEKALHQSERMLGSFAWLTGSTRHFLWWKSLAVSQTRACQVAASWPRSWLSATPSSCEETGR
jgi:hypothetical protein